jgi:hypothetical protein
MGPLFFERCEVCVHFAGGSSCKAFPDRIPDEIVTGKFDHARAHPDDHGIRFAPMTGQRSE